MKLKAIWLMVAVFSTMVSGCLTPKDASTGTAIAKEVCDQLADNLQDEPDWVKFACDAVDIGGNVIQHYTAKVPKAQAAKFGALHKK